LLNVRDVGEALPVAALCENYVADEGMYCRSHQERGDETECLVT
jgi:hypothetical protein